VKIKLTSCGEGKFTCNDGQCVDMEERCNQIPNCRDKSDEDSCKMLIMSDNYNKKIAPFDFDFEERKIIPVNINISIAVKDILSIQEVNLVYVLKFRLLMEWYDYRLTYHNLKMERSSNLLAKEDIQELWIPFVVFENTENNDATKNDDDTEITITRESDFIPSLPDTLDEINIFTGKENRITFQQVYSKTFKCEYQLQLYPFDTQRCSVDLEVRELEQFSMRLIPDMMLMESDTVLTQYIISSWSLVYRNDDDPSAGVALQLVLKRRLTNELLTTYLPSILIISIVYSTNFFKPFFFEAVVTVNLTAFLVLTTLFISVAGKLPPTAYVKMVDIWLIFCQLVPFVEVLLHTFMDCMRDEENREINHHGKSVNVGQNDPVEAFDQNPGEENGVKKIFVVSTNSEEDKQAASPTFQDMTQRNEKELVEARKQYYQNLVVKDKWLKIGEFAAVKLLPLVFLVFTSVYWAYGLFHFFDASTWMA